MTINRFSPSIGPMEIDSLGSWVPFSEHMKYMAMANALIDEKQKLIQQLERDLEICQHELRHSDDG